MARFKPAGSRKAKSTQSRGGFIPCVVLLVIGFLLLFLLFYALVNSGTTK